jgi:hypothetical protein
MSGTRHFSQSRRRSRAWNAGQAGALVSGFSNDEVIMRSILLFAIGVPVPVILLLAFCTHHF